MTDDFGFHVWGDGDSATLEIGELMLKHFLADQLVRELGRLGVAEEIRASKRARVGQEGTEYRILPLPVHT